MRRRAIMSATASLFVAASALPAAATQMLTAAELAADLGGRTIKGYYVDTRVNFVEVYLPGGRITYKDDLKADAGRWSVRGDSFCTFYDRINGACWFVLKRSVNCYEFFPAFGETTTTLADLLTREPEARAARESDKVTCESWLGS
jgi:hypothetical protein